MEFVNEKVKMIQCSIQKELLSVKFPDFGHSNFRLLSEIC